MGKNNREESKEKLQPRELQGFEEKLDFLRTRFITQTKPLVDPDHAEVIFGGDLFIGTINLSDKEKLMNSLGININKPPNFRLAGQFEFDAWLVPESFPPLYLLKRGVEGEIEILAFEETLLEIFEEAENLKRVDKIQSS